MTSLVPCLVACLLGTHFEPGEEPPWAPACCAGRAARPVLQSYDPRPGDILLFSSCMPVGNLLFLLANSGGATHTAIVVERPNGTLALLEAPGPRYPVMLSDPPVRLQSYHGRVWVRRLRAPLRAEQSARLTAFACAQEGKPYSKADMFGPLFRRPVRKPGSGCAGPDELDPPVWFCSSLTAAAAVAAGLLDPCVVRPRTTDPDDLKSDCILDLSPCWEKPVRYHRCGPRLPGWWSESCCGQRAYWE